MSEISIHRREMIALGGAAVAGGLVVSGCSRAGTTLADAMQRAPQDRDVPIPGVRTIFTQGDLKPVYVATENVQDPVAFSVAATLSWGDILAEHAMFFSLLNPGPELEKHRAKADEFAAQFETRVRETKAARLTKEDYAAFNRRTAEMVKPMVDWKLRMAEMQERGHIRGLVFPSVYREAAREGQHFADLLEGFNRGQIQVDRVKALTLWLNDNRGHAGVIAHLLDPQEKELVRKAMDYSERFEKLLAKEAPARGNGPDPILQAAREMLDFETAIERDVQGARVKSVIHPLLADHMRREAVLFIEDLKRLGQQG